MRKILAFVLACVLMLLSVSAVADSEIETGAETVAVTAPEADDSFVFTFRDGITWNTTLDELKAIFPEHTLYETDTLDEEEVLGYKAFVSRVSVS